MTGWRPGGAPRRIERRVDAHVAGSATALRFPEAAVCIDSASRDRWTIFGRAIGPIDLEEDAHIVQIEANITTYVCFDGMASIRRVSEGGDVIVSFPERTALTLGFRSRVRAPTERLTVPPTPAGVATAVTHAAGALATTSPDRSYPSLRGHPPAIDLGETPAVPESVIDRTPETGIRLRVPDDLGSVLVLAPLAYYLQSSVVVEDRPAPRLEAPAAGLVRDLDPLPELQHQAADLLYRVFMLDCLTRNVGPYGTDLVEVSLLDEVGLDAASAYEASPVERLRRYLEIPFGSIAADLPDWHFSMYVDPAPDRIPTLPYVLDRLALVYLPRSSSPDRESLLRHSLEGSRRAVGRPGDRVPTVDPVLPEFHRGRVRGWLSEGAPIDAFKAVPAAFENRFDYFDHGGEEKTVTVVLNDEGMADEESTVARIYRDRAEDLSIEVDIRRQLARDELRAVFETPRDFVHYIGHCTTEGLQCLDGALSADEIGESNVRTFFLNACGSYYEGLELIDRGSVAGAVTLERVLDNHATRVGTIFARLIVHGFSIERALQLAQQQAILENNYLVVGDGTYVLSQNDDLHPLFFEIKSLSDDVVNMRVDSFFQHTAGGFYQLYSSSDNHRLSGNGISKTISRPELLNHLEIANDPVIYDGEYYWSDELHAKLSDELRQ